MEKADGREEGEEVQVEKRKKGKKKEEDEEKEDNTLVMRASGSCIRANMNSKQDTVIFMHTVQS